MLRLREESPKKPGKQKIAIYNIAEIQTADHKVDREKDKRKPT